MMRERTIGKVGVGLTSIGRSVVPVQTCQLRSNNGTLLVLIPSAFGKLRLCQLF